MARLFDWLRPRDDVRIIGPDNPTVREPTVSLLPLKKSLDEVYASLTEHRLMVGQGHFYAYRVLEAMGIPTSPGVIRLSFLHYTSVEEIDQLIEGLSAALG